MFREATIAAGTALLLCSASLVHAEQSTTMFIPESSTRHPGDGGKFAHTNTIGIVASPVRGAAGTTPSGKIENPASLACLYGLRGNAYGCNPEVVTSVSSGGTRAIAVVDAYDYPTAAADLAAYSRFYGLPPADLDVVYATGLQPAAGTTGNWEAEAALDIESVHALAPHAKIYLVEAATNATSDLLVAVDVATQLVVAAGGGQVSMSWGAEEFVGENVLGGHFSNPNVTYVAAAGDAYGAMFPACLPDVVSVGGASVDRKSDGRYSGWSVWSGTGGGKSSQIPRPGFQSGLARIVSIFRGTPDISGDANPATGTWVYEAGSWSIWGGTSLATPQIAALLNSRGFFGGTAANLAAIYGGRGLQTMSVPTGTCGSTTAVKAVSGYDLCTGIGVPH